MEICWIIYFSNINEILIKGYNKMVRGYLVLLNVKIDTEIPDKQY